MNPEDVQILIDKALQAQQDELNFYRKYLSDKIVFSRDMKIDNGRNFQFGRNEGTKFGTSIDQLISFYGVQPVNQPAKVDDPTGGATVDTQARNAVIFLIDRLEELGLIAPNA